MSEQPPLPLTYELRTVADFMALPPEKMDACLLDFAAWLAMHMKAREIAGQFRIATPTDVFAWVDDGKHIATVTLSHEGEVIASHSHEFAPPEPPRG